MSFAVSTLLIGTDIAINIRDVDVAKLRREDRWLSLILLRLFTITFAQKQTTDE